MADPTAVVIVVGGQLLTPFAQIGKLRIDDVLNDAPNTAALSLVYARRIGPPETGPFAAHAFDHVGFNVAFNRTPMLTPPPVAVGAPIQVYLGAIDPASQIFGGFITVREQTAEFDQPQHVRYHLTCTDFTRRLNRRKVLKDYGQQSATAIVTDLIATFAPGISAAFVEAALPTITGGITFTFEEVSRALSRVAEKIGAYWYVDYVGALHFFTGTEAGPDPAPIVPGGDFADLKVTVDLSQVRTRVLVEGDGATALLTLLPSDSILPISQTLPFNAAGGRAKVGTARITYTGIHAGGTKVNTVGVGTGGTAPPAAPGAPTVAVAGSPGSLAGGPYYYAVSFELSDGARSDVGTWAGPITVAAAPGPGITTAALPTNPIPGPIKVGVFSDYATSFVAANGSETAPGYGGNQVTGRAVLRGGLQTFSASSPGNMAPGNYYYATTFLTPGGETIPSDPIPIAISSGACSLTVLNAPDSRVTGKRIYRSSVSAGTPVLPWRHVVDIPNNVDQTFIDRAADAELAPRQLPAFNSATDQGEGAVVTLPLSGDARVVRRRLYRRDGAGQFRLIAELPDNTTTTFNDVVVGGGGGLAPTSNAINTGAINVTAIPLGPAGTARRRLFRTLAGGSQLREVTALGDNSTTTYLDSVSDGGLGGAPLPPQGGPGAAAPPTAAGSAVLRVDDLTGLPAAGWVAVEAQLLRYTGTSTAGGNFLTGLPATGPGSIAADIPAGTVVSASPALVGVSPLVGVTLGDAVQLLAQVDDLPAQAALAVIEGGDGIIEHYIQDRRLSEAGALARGRAELELFKTVETSLHYSTHDPKTRTGRLVSVALPAPTNVTGEFLIQQVTIENVSFAREFFPRFVVEASTTRFSFDDVLNRLLMESA